MHIYRPEAMGVLSLSMLGQAAGGGGQWDMVGLRPRELLQGSGVGSSPPVAVCGKAEEALPILLLERPAEQRPLFLEDALQKLPAYPMVANLEETPLFGSFGDVPLAPLHLGLPLLQSAEVNQRQTLGRVLPLGHNRRLLLALFVAEDQ